MKQIVQDSQQRQLAVDELRAHGNAFFAESLDHIGTLAGRDPFWRKVHQYGALFRQQFEANSGQVAPPQKAEGKKEEPTPKE